MERMTIGEVAKRAGLRPSTLRYYESVGLLPTPERRSGRRYYEADVLPLLAMVTGARRLSFNIADLQILFGGDGQQVASGRWRTLARRKVAELDAQIHQAQQMKQVLEKGMYCQCTRPEECVVVEELTGAVE